MNLFEKFLLLLQGEIETPKMYGLFHLICLGITMALIIYSIINKKYTETRLKRILAIYGIGAFILELLKQLIWTFNFDSTTNIITWDYNWYATPFQLCSTPIYVSLICLFLKKSKLRDSLLSYIAYITILGSIATALYPQNVFVRTILVDIHTMYLHLGSLFLSIYLLISKEVKIDIKSYISGYKVFIIFAAIAELLNITIYHSGILNGETFNMFYISPYFISELPVFNIIQERLPFILFIIIYFLALFLGSIIVYLISYIIKSKKHA